MTEYLANLVDWGFFSRYVLEANRVYWIELRTLYLSRAKYINKNLDPINFSESINYTNWSNFGNCLDTCCSVNLRPIVIKSSLKSSKFKTPSQSSSKHVKAFRIRSSGSAEPILEANMDRNLAKSTFPCTSFSISLTSLSVGFCPREIKIFCRSSLLITPSRSWSMRLNASFSWVSCSLLMCPVAGCLVPTVLLNFLRGRILLPSLW